MIACTFRMETEDDGNKVLTGVLNYPLDRGAILVLRKVREEYRLIAVSGDGRRGDCTQQTLTSFMDTDVPCSWCPGRQAKNKAAFILGKEGKVYVCEECSEFEQFKKYTHRTRIV